MVKIDFKNEKAPKDAQKRFGPTWDVEWNANSHQSGVVNRLSGAKPSHEVKNTMFQTILLESLLVKCVLHT